MVRSLGANNIATDARAPNPDLFLKPTEHERNENDSRPLPRGPRSLSGRLERLLGETARCCAGQQTDHFANEVEHKHAAKNPASRFPTP